MSEDGEQHSAANGTNGNTGANGHSKKREATEYIANPDVVNIFKHPLSHEWCLWYYRNNKDKDWESNLAKIITFGYVEDFWSVYNFIKGPSELDLGTDYYIFKDGIRPMWEDPANRRGGRWLICIEKKLSLARTPKTDEYWLNLILIMIGQTFDNFNDEICGITVNVRPKMDKIGLWTANASKAHEEAIRCIGETIKRELKMTRDNMIYYQTHQESSNRVPVAASMFRM